MHSRLRQLVALVLGLALCIAAIPPAPAAAISGVDIFQTANVPAGWTVDRTTACASPLNCLDADDSSYSFHGYNSGLCGGVPWGMASAPTPPGGSPAQLYCGMRVKFDSASSSEGDVPVTSARFAFRAGATCGGCYNSVERVWFGVINDGVQTICYESPSGTTYAGADTWGAAPLHEIEVDLTGCTLDDASGFTGSDYVYVVFNERNVGGQAPDVRVYSFEAAANASAEFEEYLANLRLDHPPFKRVISWDWIKTWDGVWSVTDSDDDVLDGGISGATSGAHEFTDITCPLVCAHDTYTVTIHEDGHETVTYEIDSDDSGELIPPLVGIRIGGITACYNADFEQCGSGELATTLSITYSILPVDHGDDVLVEIGSQYLFGPGFDGDPWYSDTVDGGTHTVNMTVTAPYPVGGQLGLLVATSPANGVQATFVVDWVDGGSGPPVVLPPGGGGGTDDDPEPDFEPCGPFDAACAIRNLGLSFAEALDDALGGAEDIWSSAVAGLVEGLTSREPFATAFWAVDGMLDQIDALNSEVESETDCGDIITISPIDVLYDNFDSLLPDEPDGTFAFWTIDCASFAFLLETDWYPVIRAAMDPALLLAFGYSELRRLQPKTQL